MNPLDYGLCRDTVTVYRRQQDGVFRQVLETCLLTWEDRIATDTYGTRKGVDFLLIHPSSTQQIFPGDRVYAGLGPEIQPEQWGEFLPAAVPGLGQVQFVRTYRHSGEICHTEAGCNTSLRLR